MTTSEVPWLELPLPDIEVGEVTTVVVRGRPLCVTRTEAGWGVLDNRCPHRGLPLGEGYIDDGYLVCPYHAYAYDPITGVPEHESATPAHPYRTRPTADGGLEVRIRPAEGA